MDSYRPLLFAHRGSTLLAPENTQAAFDLALHHHSDVLEIDVRLSHDGNVIVTHDANVDRTTDGTGAVADKTLTQLKTLDAAYRFFNLDGQHFRGRKLRLLTLEEVLALYPQTGINIDIKDNLPEAADAVCRVLAKSDRMSGVEWLNVGSFHSRVIQRFRQLMPECSTAATRNEIAALYFTPGNRYRQTANSDSQGEQSLVVKKQLDSDAASLQTLPFQCAQIPVSYMGMPLSGKRFIRKLQALGATVVYWTINDPTLMDKLYQRRVDGIVTDRVDIAQIRARSIL